MENHVPFVGVALGLWLVLVAVSAGFARRALVAFLLGLLFTAAFVGYCMFYQGVTEMGGSIQALFGGVYGVLFFKLISWVQSRYFHAMPRHESPNKPMKPTPR